MQNDQTATAADFIAAARNIAEDAQTTSAISHLSRVHRVAEDALSELVMGLRIATLFSHYTARVAGWWDDLDAAAPMVFGTKVALIHSEVSEALEGGRKGLKDDHLSWRRAEEVELADALIRIFDLAGARHLDLGGALVEKLAYNHLRADHQREARNAPGGKAF